MLLVQNKVKKSIIFNSLQEQSVNLFLFVSFFVSLVLYHLPPKKLFFFLSGIRHISILLSIVINFNKNQLGPNLDYLNKKNQEEKSKMDSMRI